MYIGIGVLLQLLFAGLWHARVFNSPEAHIFFGLSLLLAALIALIAALVGRMGRRVAIPTAILFVLILLQPFLIEMRYTDLAYLSALHTVNAGFIGMTSGLVAAASRTAVLRSAPRNVPAAQPVSAD
jgi:hypothetical protein